MPRLRIFCCLCKVIQEINQEGTTILLVEQNVLQALKIAQYVYAVETGKMILHGEAKDTANNPRVMEAYLGGKKTSSWITLNYYDWRSCRNGKYVCFL